jgi:hypothetical protein
MSLKRFLKVWTVSVQHPTEGSFEEYFDAIKERRTGARGSFLEDKAART